ncbi:LOW QUALITY PROTEIN: vacuolar import and degradation protein-domain-containing protein, partial [Jimgerdemannia flammicorona]
MPILAALSPMPSTEPSVTSKCPLCLQDAMAAQHPCRCNHKMQQIAISQAQRANIRPPPTSALGDITRHRMMQSRTGWLYSGSRFKGEQKSERSSYEVSVDIQVRHVLLKFSELCFAAKCRIGLCVGGSLYAFDEYTQLTNFNLRLHVDLNESFLCGYLHIKGLTSDYPELTTFFEAEIIGPKYSFLTRKWEADESIDKSHWMKFDEAFEQYKKDFNKDGFVYDFHNKDFLFMRWKEHFLVPDHRVNNIDGASFAGFYYICYQRSTGTITGFYFHSHSE